MITTKTLTRPYGPQRGGLLPPDVMRGVMDELYCEFRASVRNATAHQRLAWMAAAQKEGVEP